MILPFLSQNENTPYLPVKKYPVAKTTESCGFVYQYTDYRHYVVEGEGLEDGRIYELTPETLIMS